MAKEIKLEPSRSFREFRLLTGKTTIKNITSKVSLRTKLCTLPGKKGKFINLNIPFISAAMQAVTGIRMGIALAQHGGIGVTPCSIPISEQVSIIQGVKQFKAGFHEDVFCVKATDSLKSVAKTIKEKGYNSFPVTSNGKMNGKLLGVIRDREFDLKGDLDLTVKERMSKRYLTAKEGITLKDSNSLMIKNGATHVYVMDTKSHLKFVVFRKDLLRQMEYPEGTIDHNRRYCIAGSVSTQPKDQKRVDALIEAEADAIFIDSSDGFTQFQKDVIDYVRTKSKTIPVIGGNVITREGFRFLAESGFNAVKVGMGIGSGCITQEQKGTGRGQATAIREIVEERDIYLKETGTYIPIISDGGIGNSSHMVIGLAMGSDSIMMGRFFAQYSESSSAMRKHPQLGPVKEYWMEASNRARNYGRYETSKDLFFEEGVEGFVPLTGSMHDNIWEPIQKIKSALSNAGCANIPEFHKDAVLELQSIASIQDGGIHDIITN